MRRYKRERPGGLYEFLGARPGLYDGRTHITFRITGPGAFCGRSFERSGLYEGVDKTLPDLGGAAAMSAVDVGCAARDRRGRRPGERGAVEGYGHAHAPRLPHAQSQSGNGHDG